MLKAVVFDDEYIVLEGLRRMIDWTQYGIELVGTASDGFSALELFRGQAPDIVLTDIRMPGLTGLEVLEVIMKEAPDTACIVFSGFNEVAYLKKAIKLGVIDYLEKPVTLPMIEDVLAKTMKKIQEQRRVQILQEEWEESQQDRLERATLHLLLGEEGAGAAWEDAFGEAACRVKAVTVLALSGEYTFLPEPDDYQIVPVRHAHERLGVVFHFTNYSEELIRRLLVFSSRLVIGSGRTVPLNQAPQSYDEARHALKYGLFMDESGWIRFEDIGENNALPLHMSEPEKNIIFKIRTGDEGGLLTDLQAFTEQLEQQKLSPDVLESEVLKLIYLAQEVAKETGGDIHTIKEGGYAPQQEIRDIQTKEQLFDWLFIQMDLLMKWMERVRSTEKREAIERASAYMEARFNQDLTLQEVAEHVGMNSTYFSLYFKEKAGMSYIKYLTKIRIEKAKELLYAGGKVSEVSEQVGYHSYRHFSELFKKQTGVSPGQYRESI